MSERQLTEQVLRDWRYGQTQAERMAADILVTEKYESVDPQLPLGGPDGVKDILCRKDGAKWVAACYFPATQVTFNDVSKKLSEDSKGISKNKATGIIFFVNQYLSPSERVKLGAEVKDGAVEIYHLERMRTVLDSPKGYGMRLEYLRIPMSNEEQLGLWSEFKDNLSEGIKRQESLITNLHEKMDVLMVRTSAMSDNLTTLPSSLLSTSAAAEATLRFPTSLISIELLLWLQRMLAEGSAISSGLRNVNVWLGDSGATFENATFVPIGPKRVPGDLKTLLDGWRSNYSRYIMYDESSKVRVIAEFHYEFLRIHPFLDGNGRVARAILQQQVKELLDKDVRSVFTDDPKNYYEALSKANEGDLEPLLALVQSVIE